MNTCHDNHIHTNTDDSLSNTSHKIFIPKPSILKKLTIILKCLDNTIYELYTGLMLNLDIIINDLEIPKFLKNILHTRQILFFAFFLGNFVMILNNINIDKFEKMENSEQNHTSEYEINLFFVKTFLYFLFLFFFGLNIFLLTFLKFRNFSQMKITRYEELEKFVLTKSKELSNNLCHTCNVVRCTRSFHCNYCNQCITKFSLHSNWFNTCIGSQNLLVYSTELIFLNLFFIVSILNYSLQIFLIGRECEQLFDFKRNLFFLHFWFFLSSFLEFKLLLYTKGFLGRNLFRNLTEYEYGNQMRLPYLWKNAQKEFLNPFDRGCLNNFKEVWAGFRNRELDLDRKINDELMKNENFNGCSVRNLVDEKFINAKNSCDDDFIFLNNEINLENNLTIENPAGIDHKETRTKIFEYFVTNDNQIYYQVYNPDIDSKTINWNRIRLYTILDLINSPFRKILLISLGRENEIDI